jgi:hypothetical protein
LGGASLSFYSCDNSVCENDYADNILQPTVCINSSLTSDEYNNIVNRISNKIKYSTRSLGYEVTENEAKEILTPLITNGQQIQQQFLEFKDTLDLTDEEVLIVENLTESQLAELSFTLNTIYNDAVETESISSEDIIECLKYATGIEDLLDILEAADEVENIKKIYQGTKMLMTAKTTKQIIRALAKRTSGYVGIVWMIYEFGDCINNRK